MLLADAWEGRFEGTGNFCEDSRRDIWILGPLRLPLRANNTYFLVDANPLGNSFLIPVVDMEKEMDLIALCRYLWSKRRFIVVVLLCGFVLGAIIAFGIPKEYTSKVKLLPLQTKEDKEERNASVASMIGLSFSTTSYGNFSVGLYSEILKSTPFLVGLADTKVTPSGLTEMTLFDYLVENQTQAWWTRVVGIPLRLFSSKADTVSVESMEWDMFYLTPRQQNYIDKLSSKIVTWEDKTSGLLNIEVSMQDPVVAAVVADALVESLKLTLRDIRRRKLESDLHYVEKMYDEAKNAYRMLEEQKGMLNDRQLEMEASMGLYNMIARQFELLQVNVTDDREMFSTIETARVMVDFSKPNRKMVIFVFTFLALFGGVVWVILKRLFER